MQEDIAGDAAKMANWTFLTNHAHVLLCIAEDSGARIRDIAERVGITERAVQRIVSELETDGYVSRTREGRENRYRIHPDLPLRHPIERHRTIRDLMKMVRGRQGGEMGARQRIAT